MGNLLSQTIFGGPHMIIDRMIVAEPYRIEVGVCGVVGKEDNPFKTQVIRVNNERLKPLVSFVETNNALEYKFEDDITLRLMKRENDIVYYIKTNDIEHTSNMHPLVQNNWKTISLASEELDKIATFVKNNE